MYWWLALVICSTIIFVPDTSAKYHHIKLRHGRHRRQHGESYLPGSFVLDTDEPERGNWGPWSTPNSCSRSCGGGVAHQTRQCLDIDDRGFERCTGASRRFFSCNVEPCPGEPKDFRAEQCAEFNNVPFEDIYYDWIPYTGGPNKCELNCMPRGERFFYRHKLKVIDGTPCDVEKNDVCVEGRCMPVGCDMMLGSQAKEDSCRQCGGDGSNCNTVNGLFDADDLQVGYIDILLIPEGATNVVVKEIRPSNNYLAIRNTSGHYYLNGNWRIDFPRSLRFAGTIFHYSRDPQGFSAPDTITALGPTCEPIYVVLLYQDHNVGVNYEYSIPKKVAQQFSPDNYTWVTGEFSSCSVSCGGGYQSRRVACVRKRDNQPVDESLCDPQSEPADTQGCGDEACPPEWVENEWSPCSKPCGEGGEQSREIKCEQVVSGGIPTVVDDSQCVEKFGPKSETTRECNKDLECPQWHIGPWKPCDHLCGEGKQTRQVTCYKKTNDTESHRFEVLDDSACKDEAPEREKTCELRPCAGLDWIVSEWSGCGDKCGLTQETRTATCATEDGKIYSDDKCDASKKPELTRKCESVKNCDFQWYTAQWSDCSAKCGSGIQTRDVFCATFEGDSLKKVPQEKCDPEKKYEDTQNCTAEVEECKGEWFAGPWSKCSKPCGGGEITRKVICLQDGMVVKPENCDVETIMFSSEDCNKQPCDTDEVIVEEPDKVTALTDEEEEEDECEVYEDDFVSVSPGFDMESKESGMTEVSPLSSPFVSDGTATDEELMFSDASPFTRGDISPSSDFTSDYTSGVGSGDDADSISTFFTNTGSTSETSSDFEGSGTSPEEGSTSETDISEMTEEGSGATSEISEATEVSQTSASMASGATDASGITDPSGVTESSSGMTESSSGITDSSSGITDSSSGVTEESTMQSTDSSDTSSNAGSTLESGATEESSTVASSESSGGSEATTASGNTEDSSSGSSEASPATTESTDVTTSSETGSSETSTDFTSSSPTDLTETTGTGVSDTSETATSETPTSDTPTTDTTDTTDTATTSSDVTETTSSTVTEESMTTAGTDFSSESSASSEMSTSEGTTEGSTDGSTESSTDGSTEGSTEGSTDGSTEGSTSATSDDTDSSTTESSTSDTQMTTEASTEVSTEASTETSTELSGSTESTQDQSSASTDVSATSESGMTDTATTGETSEASSTVSGATSESEMSTVSGETADTGMTTESGLTTESGASTESGMTTMSEGSTESGATSESSESSTESGATTESGESTMFTETTESGMTTVSGEFTETTMFSSTMSSEEEETDHTGKTTITDYWSTLVSKEHTKLRKCKVWKKKKTCKTTEFGCCYDGVTAAQGPFGKGCPTPKTCNETQFGCCSDGVSPATGPKNQGCPDTHCEETLFGCCPDKMMPAAGNNFEGCKKPCNETEFGCCPDKETPASGKDNLGCCNVTTFGCCPDGIKPATGPNEEGCEEEVTTSTDVSVETTPMTEDCANSTFGCCPDGVRTATGSNFEGCGVIDPKNCTASYFGCCPDGVNPALGPRYHGCHMPCENTTYGCCDDGVTPAHGLNKEGCCLSTPYQCCPDNILPARGPNFYGCGCQYSRFGCCPDNSTAARGPNNEGCGCHYTPHGCCPNRFTPASGPNFEGCPCYTYQFGCCPDGVTIAKGQYGHGCGCDNTEFKCCSDGRTPAKGPNFAGCTCDASKYGCCADGVEEAQGEDFEGCLSVPVTPGAACSLERDRGSCRDFTVKWFFDTEYGGCSRFWYGGCEGNDNRFKTQEECKEVCVKPKGRDVCFLPKITGPCEGYYPTWYFDAGRKQCGQFVYGGCLGNANRFKTREECESLCVIPDDIDPCDQPKESGPCLGNFTRWYFNKEAQTCQQFTYGGCKPNNNNFPTEVACHQQCLQPGRSRDSCSLPRAEGSCTEKHSRWYFDQSENRCMPFYYTGCGGNKNNFESREACETDCPPKIEQDICLLPALLGECHNYTARWYFDSYEQRCRQFFYGGCGGNENNFRTADECAHRCESPVTTPPAITPPAEQEFRIEFCFMRDEHGPCSEEQVKWFYDSRDGVCKQFTYGGCQTNGNKFNTREECEYRCGSAQDSCSLPKVIGPCDGFVRQYYYDRRTDSCEEFEYSGCQGNKNRFQDRETCERQCRREPHGVPPPEVRITTPQPPAPQISQICLAPADAGPCNGDITAYYYDTQSQSCQAFIYGGCEGNANRFHTEEQCERLCGRFQGQDMCNLPVDPGPCRGTFPKFFYDPNVRGCREYRYGGCDGNANRFSTISECESVCIHHEEPLSIGNDTSSSHLASNEIDVDSGKDSKDPCAEAREECGLIRCPYGKEAFVDNQDCERCRCVDPCRTQSCPEGTQCAITLVAIKGATEYKGVCRATTKPGNCPHISNSTRCEQECNTDADCSGDWKCCNNGCGTSCLEPASEEVWTTQPPPIVVPVTTPQWNQSGIPEPAAIQQPENPQVRAEEGHFITMTCIVTGNPKPVITWRKDTTLIDNAEKRRRILLDGSLQIVNLYSYDRGTYVCTADNGLGPPVRTEYQLEITVPVSVNISAVQNQFPESSDINIACNVDGYPIPRVSWFKDDVLIQPSNRITISDANRLAISDARKEDSGQYRCEATNEYTTASDSVDIRVAGIFIHPNCQDNTFFAKCDLIVQAKYCQHKYYAKFCCRSCTEAGQLSSRGPHLDSSRRRRSLMRSLV